MSGEKKIKKKSHPPGEETEEVDVSELESVRKTLFATLDQYLLEAKAQITNSDIKSDVDSSSEPNYANSELKNTLRMGLRKLNQMLFKEEAQDESEATRHGSVSTDSGSSDSSLEFDNAVLHKSEAKTSEKSGEIRKQNRKTVNGIKRRQTLEKNDKKIIAVDITEGVANIPALQQLRKTNSHNSSLVELNTLERTKGKHKSVNKMDKRKTKNGSQTYKPESPLLEMAHRPLLEKTRYDSDASFYSDFDYGTDFEGISNEFAASSKQLAIRAKGVYKKSLGTRLFSTHLNKNYMRRLVSQNRKRYVDKSKGYDLDLVYVEPKLIAMGHPSRGLEVLYRNSYHQVMRFFEETHKGHYRIYNLCMKRKYPLKINTESYGFEDHNACPMTKLFTLLDDIEQWLSANELNVAVVHCKAGKGRTGLVSSCFLIKKGAFGGAQEAIDHFGFKRTVDGRGLTVASQRRYVYYYEKARKSELGEHAPDFDIQQTVREKLMTLSLHQRVRMPAHGSPKFYLARVEIRNIPNWLRSWRSGLVLKLSAGVPAVVTPLSQTKTGDFLYPSQFNDRTTRELGVKKKKRRRVTLSRVGKNTKYENSFVWSSNALRSVSNAWQFLSVNGNYEGGVNEVPVVQGDFRIEAYNENPLNLKRKKKKKLFQLWLNTNFFKVQYGSVLLDSYQIDKTWMNSTPDEGFTLYKDDLASVHKFDKFSLDGKLAKDTKNKYFPEDFQVIFQFRLTEDQPVLRT